MSQLLETLLFQDGKLQNIETHNERLNQTRLELFGTKKSWNIGQIFDDWIAENNIKMADYECFDIQKNYWRCRIVYDKEAITNIEIVKTERKTIKTIELIRDNNIDYRYKWTNRSILEKYKKNTQADDFLIVKDGYLTDTFAANVVFFDGLSWITPDKPLLKGTKRQLLLSQNIIKETSIKELDLENFSKMRLINATSIWDESADIDVKSAFNLQQKLHE